MIRRTRSSSGAVMATVQSQWPARELSSRPMASMPTTGTPSARAWATRAATAWPTYLWVMALRSARACSSWKTTAPRRFRSSSPWGVYTGPNRASSSSRMGRQVRVRSW